MILRIAEAGALAEELVKYGLKELTPDLYKAVSWFTWAKKGMELFKDFVFDPWLEGQQMETYAARRDEGSEPADAFVAADALERNDEVATPRCGRRR